MDSAITLTTDSLGISRLTLNRPEIHNAFDDALIVELTNTLSALSSAGRTRVLVLDAAGKSFSAGADLNWMQRTANSSEQENKRDAIALADLMHALYTFPHPTIAAIQGAALGGGVGLVACCDIAIAAERSMFALSEVKLGLIPAAISPFVIKAIGERAARRYFLTAERFDSATALALGLLHERVADENLKTRVEEVITLILESGPQAQVEAKDLIFSVVNKPIDAPLRDDTASRIARVRASAEGREGISAFLEKRRPDWQSDGKSPDSDAG